MVVFKHIVFYMQNLHHISVKTTVIHKAFVTFRPQFTQQHTKNLPLTRVFIARDIPAPVYQSHLADPLINQWVSSRQATTTHSSRGNL
jgi:hypothetical protein